MEQPPKISIIVPCFNGAKTLMDCLTAIKLQDYPNIEVLFVDNESTDGSLALAEYIAREGSFPQLKVLGSVPNIHKYSWEEPVSFAMEHMTGDYFTIIGVDDYIHYSYISNNVDLLLQNPDWLCWQTGMYSTDGVTEEAHGKTYQTIEELKSLLVQACVVHTPTVFYKTSLKTDGHMTYNSKEYLGSSDYDLYCQLTDKGIFIHATPMLYGYFYRKSAGQASKGMFTEYMSGNRIDDVIRSKWKQKWKL